MKPLPSDAELIDQAFALQEALEVLLPSEELSAGAVASLVEALGRIVEELRGEREPHIVRLRHDGLSDHLGIDVGSTLEIPEGREVAAFLQAVARRAEILDLPRIVPPPGS